MQSFDFKKLLPQILIIVGFILFALFFAYPQMQGMVLQQSDNIQWRAMAKEAIDWHEKTGENTFWTNSIFGGMPTYSIYVPESNNYIFRIMTLITDGIGKPAGFIFAALLCFYILMQTLKVNRWLSIVGAIAYAFSSYYIVIIAAGHEGKVMTMAFMPAVIGGILLVYRAKWLSGIPLLAFSLALMICAGHYQIIYYAMILVAFMIIGLFIIALKEKNLKQFFISSAVSAVIAVIAVGPMMPMLLVTAEYNKETMRGGESELTITHDANKKDGGLDKNYAFRWSNDVGETLCLLVPKLYGGSSSEPLSESSNTYEKLTSMGVSEDQASQMMEHVPLYWGSQPFLSGPVYFGAIICFLFVLGILVIRSQHKWWVIAAAALSIIMSWGNHFAAFNYFLFDTLPLLNKFRAPSTVLVVAELLFPMLAIWAISDIIKGKVDAADLWKNIKISAIVTGGLCLVLALGSSALFDFRAPASNDMSDERIAAQYGQAFGNPQAGQEVLSAIREDRADIAMKSSLISAIYIALAAGLLWAYSKKKIKDQVLIGGLGLLIAVDLISVAKDYLNEGNFVEATDYESLLAPRPVDQQIKQDPDPYYRVLDLTTNVYNDAIPAAHHKLIGGYSPAKLERYQDMIEVHMSNGFNAQVLNMLNTKYLIVPNGQQAGVIPNPDALGNAWFVDEVKWANTADEEILSLNASKFGDTVKVPNAFDPRHTAVMRNTFKNEFGNYSFSKDSAAKVQLTKYGLNDLTFQSNNAANGLAVFSDIYYPHGWKAFVDGKETPIMKADYILRAIKIPAGQHKIEFRFHPQKYFIGNTIALITSLIIYGIGIVCLILTLKRNGVDKPVNG